MTAAAPASAQLPRPGDMIAGKYLLDRLLGQGGMGAVFAAKHVKLSKAVAIKIMLADTSNPEAAARFVNEGRAAATIDSDHVVRVSDVDEELGYAYMVLELLDGEDLSQLLEREPTHRLPYHVAVGYTIQALLGVMQAHAIGIVHRDLKPSNLFLTRRKDGSTIIKVLDFGISKAQGSSALAAAPSALTSTKAMLGSPLYMSPEQLRSSKSVDHRADIWAIGIILYELITGHLPFMGDNLGELFAAILETDPAPLRTRADGIPPGLEEVVLRCLARKPENRFQTVAELLQALTPFATAQPGFATSGVNSTGQPLAGTAVLAAGALTPSGPQPRPQFMNSGSATGGGLGGTGSASRSAGGTMAFGQNTPQPGFHQTASGGWQSTGSNGAVPKSKAPIVLAAALGGVFLFGGIALIAYTQLHKAEPAVAASVSAPPPSATPLPTAAPTPTQAATTTPTAVETAASASATAATHPPPQPTTKPTHHATNPTPPKPADPTPTPPKPDPKPTAPTAKPANTAGGPVLTR